MRALQNPAHEGFDRWFNLLNCREFFKCNHIYARITKSCSRGLRQVMQLICRECNHDMAYATLCNVTLRALRNFAHAGFDRWFNSHCAGTDFRSNLFPEEFLTMVRSSNSTTLWIFHSAQAPEWQTTVTQERYSIAVSMKLKAELTKIV